MNANTIPDAGKIVVQFGAPWCGPCKQVRPQVEELAKEHEAEFVYVDVDTVTGRDLANDMNVRAVPTIMAIKDGQELGRTGGSAPNQIRTVIKNSFGG